MVAVRPIAYNGFEFTSALTIFKLFCRSLFCVVYGERAEYKPAIKCLNFCALSLGLLLQWNNLSQKADLLLLFVSRDISNPLYLARFSLAETLR